ncbi:Organic cation transporter 1 [Armadillidium vulgare]|nr:Organic cation transporter 1 [Armadillidium vulgare]
MALTAHLSSSWKTFILTCHLPSLVFLLYWRMLPESPRWLLSRSKILECEKILIKISRINGREFSERSKNLLMEAQKEEKKIPLKTIMTYFVLTKHLLLTSLILSIGYILYSGMVLNIHNMTGSKIVNYLILALVEIPGNAIGSVSAQYFGRRLSSVAFSALSAVCSVASIFVLKDPFVLAILCVLNKMFSGALVLIVYMQIGELFPTLMRATAYGLTGIVSLAALIFIPPLIAMGSSNALLPYYILFGIGLLGIVLCSFLPETIGRPIPQTINEAVLIGTNQTYLSFIHKWNGHKYLNDQYYKENIDHIAVVSLDPFNNK